MVRSFLLLMVIFHMQLLYAQTINDIGSIYKLKEDVTSRRIGSWDRTGGNADYMRGIRDKEKRIIMDVKGAGIITHIWITMAPGSQELSRNDVIIRMYWDGCPYPSVESPIGPFFGNGWDESYLFITAPLSVTPRGGKSYVCYFPMPFAKGAKIEIEDQGGRDIDKLYFNIDYEEMKELPKNSGRFHAWYNHELTLARPDGTGKNKNGKGNYVLANIKGKGQFVGVNYYINTPYTGWYGEGDEMIFLDGDTIPSQNGTGTEDFLNTSWGPNELFQHPYFGYARINKQTGYLGHTHLYRYFIADPVYFKKSCLFTIEHGHDNNLTLDLASVAYWYQSTAAPLPRSFTKEERKPKPLIDDANIQKWQEIWRL